MEEKKYTGRGGWRGGAPPKKFKKAYTFTLTTEAKQLLEEIAAKEELTKSDVIEKTIKQYHAAMKKYQTFAIYQKTEALALANELLPEGGYIEESIVDDACTYSFREISQWSGECSALRVYDKDCNPIAVVAYWE